MESIQILVIGKHPEILATIIRLINNKPEWNGIGVSTCNEAMAAFKQQPCRVVLIGAGLSDEESDTLNQFFELKAPGVPVIEHYGGGSGLLFAEIFEALKG